MADRKATNKYYPPDWDPSKGSINKFRGQHPLRERARKLDQGILIVRFELPYPVWCLGCQEHVGRGVRFNAEKKKVGNYLTIPILSFKMKCHLCSHLWEIQTDPKNTKYVVISGAKEKVEEWDETDNGTYKLMDPKEREKIQSNPLSLLTHQSADKRKAETEGVFLNQLEQQNSNLWQDVYQKNRNLRSKFRAEKHKLIKQEKADDAIIERNGLHIKLLPEIPTDSLLSKQIVFQPENSKEKLNQALVAPLFPALKSKRRSKDKDKTDSAKDRLLFKAKTQTQFKSDPFTNVAPKNNTDILGIKSKDEVKLVKKLALIEDYGSSSDGDFK